MKRLLWLALLLPVVAFGQTKISALPSGTTLGGTESIPMVQSATTVKEPVSAIGTWFAAQISGDCVVNGSYVITCSKVSGAGTPTNGQFFGYTTGGGQGWYTPSGTGTVNSGTSGQFAYYAANGTAVSGGTFGNGLSLSGSTLSTTQPSRTVSGTSDTISCSTDANRVIEYQSASATAVTLPVCGAGFAYTMQTYGAGTVTVTPSSGTINGGSTLTVAQNRGCSIWSDGTNAHVAACNALISGTGTQQGPLGFVNSSSIAQASTQTAPYPFNTTSFAGTLKNLYVYTTNAPASGQTFTFLIIAGTNPSSLGNTTITCQITSTSNQACSDTTDTATLSAGEYWTIKVTTSATSGSTGQQSYGLEIDH